MHEPSRLGFGLASVAAVLALGAPACVPAAAGAEDPGTVWRREAAANRALRPQLELAKGKEFYLVLDTEASRLRLMLLGVVLEDFPVERIDLGVPERLFVNGGAPAELRGRVWTAGKLDPSNRDERSVMRIPDPDTPPEELEPPTPEPPPTPPARYFVRFDGSLVLEVRAEGSSSSLPGRIVEAGRRRWHDLASVATGRTPARIRVHLEDADADLLFQSLPPGTHLLVL